MMAVRTSELNTISSYLLNRLYCRLTTGTGLKKMLNLILTLKKNPKHHSIYIMGDSIIYIYI